MSLFHDDRIFRKRDFRTDSPEPGEYTACTFEDCVFAGVDLSDLRFVECVFRRCDLSNTKLYRTSLREVRFEACKMLGLRLDSAHAFGLSIAAETCMLDHGVFHKVNLGKSTFHACSFQSADFTECLAEGAVLRNCTLTGADFTGARLVNADLRGSTGFAADPRTTAVQGLRLDADQLPGLVAAFGVRVG